MCLGGGPGGHWLHHRSICVSPVAQRNIYDQRRHHGETQDSQVAPLKSLVEGAVFCACAGMLHRAGDVTWNTNLRPTVVLVLLAHIRGLCVVLFLEG